MRAIAAIALLASCAAPNAKFVSEPACITDLDCGQNGLVCFPDGCGDPGTGIVIEVTGNSPGLYAQDFAVPNGAAPTMNLDVRAPLTLSGRLQKRSDDGMFLLEYTEGVTISATGQSDLIPGVSRSYSLVLPRADQAAYQMYVGAGTYTVTARASERAVPFQRLKVTVAPGSVAGASFVFPSPANSLALTGRLVKTTKPTLTVQEGMEIQAFDTAGGLPLSQPSQVGMGGDFTLYVDSESLLLTSLTLVATPTDSARLAPTKAFVVAPVPRAGISLGDLELGDFGVGLVGTKGTIVDSAGSPVVGALVSFEGKVGGGGSFKSRKVTTDASGSFSADLLGSAGDGAYSMTVIPPPGSSAGILTTVVRAALVDGKPVLLAGSQPKITFTCPERLRVTGEVLGPNGEPAIGVRVDAAPIEAINQLPLPGDVATTTTRADGHFELLLDPARYRLDYIPPGRLPRKSRVVRVEPEVTFDAGVARIAAVGSFRLSEGRTVAGTVTVRPNTVDVSDGGVAGGGTPVPNALVRFYRVTTVEGLDSSLLIGESFTDDRGNYSVVLPAAR